MNKKMIALILTLTLVFLVACQTADAPKETPGDGEVTEEKGGTIVIGSKPMAEQYILVEILAQLIEGDTDLEVEKKLGIAGGTSNLHPAMIKGDIDLYPEYSGTGWLFVLKEELINDPDELYEETKKKYKDEYDLIWTEPYGFNNEFTLAMKKEKADELGIETFSDLAKVSKDLNFGAEYDFYEREDGFPELSKAYDLDFKDKKELDIALKYKAIDAGEVDVINAFSTDGLLKEYGMKILKDDKKFFPSYRAATIIRADALEKHPELEEVLDKMNGLISDEDMIDMNFKVEEEQEDPEDVAAEFLEEKGIR